MTALVEMKESRDPETGVLLRQLTDWRCHSWHFYYTYSGWWDDNRRLLFNSHRNNRAGTYSIDLETYDITPVLEGVTDGFFDPVRGERFGCKGRDIVGLHLASGTLRTIMALPDACVAGGMASSADGRFLCIALCQDTAVNIKGLGQGYQGFKQYFQSKPLSRILRISLDDGTTDVIHEEAAWIGHLNPSPTRAELVTYCHEGPWRDVAQRIWGLDILTGKSWPIRPQNRAEDAIGHEFWLADGEHVGYQGWMPESPIYGYARYDNSVIVERPFPVASEHFHANTPELVVGDGLRSPYVLLWRFDGKDYEGPRVLCKHRCSRHVQMAHVHPRFSPDGDYVLYTSDTTGYANVYQAFLPEFGSLPKLGDLVPA